MQQQHQQQNGKRGRCGRGQKIFRGGGLRSPKGEIVVPVFPLFVFEFGYILQLLFYNLDPQGDKLEEVTKNKEI